MKLLIAFVWNIILLIIATIGIRACIIDFGWNWNLLNGVVGIYLAFRSISRIEKITE